MLSAMVLALSSAAAPAADMTLADLRGRRAIVSVRASARVLPAVHVRQGRPFVVGGLAMQFRRQLDGSVLIEFL